MKITWIGHSCFKIEKERFSVLFDPYDDGYVPGLSSIRETANLVICSHEHGDHNARHLVEINEDGACPFIITSMESFHDDAEGSLRGKNNITILDDGKTRVAHFGDQGCMPEGDIIEELMDIDVALIPVGGHYTIDGKNAAEIVRRINAKVVIPMHFRNKFFGFDVIGEVDAFIDEMGSAEVLDSSIYDTDTNKKGVIVLTPQNVIV